MNAPVRRGLPSFALLLALFALSSACSIGTSVAAHSRTSARIALPSDLQGRLRISPVGRTKLVAVVQNEVAPLAQDGAWVFDLERESVERLLCDPPCVTPGFGASICASSDGRRLLVGATSGVHMGEPGCVRVYRWPQLELEFEVRGKEGGDGFGNCIAEIADIDGDSRPDYVVGAPWTGGRQARRGALVCFSGSDGHILRSIEGEEGECLGEALTPCGEADERGRRALAVSYEGGAEVRAADDLRLLRKLHGRGGMFPVLVDGARLALLEDDGGSWPYGSHRTLSVWDPVSWERISSWKPAKDAQLCSAVDSLSGARVAFSEGGRILSRDVLGGDARDLAALEGAHLRAACGLTANESAPWKTAIILGRGVGRGGELLLTIR